MKVLPDTNVWIAGLISRGQCAELIEHCISEHRLVASERIVAELTEVLERRFGYTRDHLERTESWLREVADVVALTGDPPDVCRDPDDNWVLLSATESCADVIVSGDSDLIDLNSYDAIPILKPAAFWHFERTGDPPRLE